MYQRRERPASSLQSAEEITNGTSNNAPRYTTKPHSMSSVEWPSADSMETERVNLPRLCTVARCFREDLRQRQKGKRRMRACSRNIERGRQRIKMD